VVEIGVDDLLRGCAEEEAASGSNKEASEEITSGGSTITFASEEIGDDTPNATTND
jgi:hypothetical protein